MGKSRYSQSSGQILHCVAARYRVLGSGLLKSRLWSLTQEQNQNLPNITMSSTTRKMPTVLANFQQQGMQIQFRTTAIDERFNISAIILFVKPVAEGYPTLEGG